MKDKLTPNVVAALAVLAVAAVALVGWFGLVSPQRSTASDLDRQIAEAQTQLAVAKASTDSGAQGGKASGASTLALARAMPERAEMAAVLRQLLRAANRTDVRLDSVTPQAAAAQVGLQRRADGCRRHRAIFRRPAVPAAPAHAGRSRRPARACGRPAVQRRFGQPGRR